MNYYVGILPSGRLEACEIYGPEDRQKADLVYRTLYGPCLTPEGAALAATSSNAIELLCRCPREWDQAAEDIEANYGGGCPEDA